MACSVQEKNTRASPASIVVRQAERDGNDLEQQLERGADRGPAPEIANRRRVANIGNGTGAPGLSRFQACRFTDISATQIHEPTTTSTTPI